MLNRTLKKFVLALIEKEKARGRKRETYIDRWRETERGRKGKKTRFTKNNLLSKRFFFTVKQSVILGII